ncbi:hypothetical protein [Corynebacterium glyciniphilum]|uniref:hypothetical protein n=1 Tax=Corynebacterium glyciniphilum TaxID=1404244 RepID=UPI0011AB71EE|nr:hypothetical protein [Corynebacterium glyciniphilum]
MSLSSLRFSRLSRAGIAAVALAPALVLAAPAAVADETEAPATDSSASATDDAEGTDDDADNSAAGSAEGSLPEGIGSEDAASSLSDADWKSVAKILGDVLGGNVSLQTILDIISVVNDGDATVGDVIGSVTGSLGGDDSGDNGDNGDNAGDDAGDAAE